MKKIRLKEHSASERERISISLSHWIDLSNDGPNTIYQVFYIVPIENNFT